MNSLYINLYNVSISRFVLIIYTYVLTCMCMYICHMYTHTFACMKIRVCMYVYLYRFTCDSFISDTAYLHLCDMLIQLNLYIYLYSFMCVSDNSMGEAHTYVYILFHTCVRRLCRRRYIHSFTRESDGYMRMYAACIH